MQENSMGLTGFVDPETLASQFGISEGMSVADFGSGSGHLGILIAQKIGKDGKLYAFDIQESALEAIRAKANAAGLANIEPRRANLEVLGSTSLPDGSQDLVLMANILFQNQKKAEIIKEGERILKSGGRMVIIDWVKGIGGFGPPDELRTDEATMEQMATAQGLALESKTNPSKFQHVMIFKKS